MSDHIVVSGTPESDPNVAKYIALEHNAGKCAKNKELTPNVTSICRKPDGHDGNCGWMDSMDRGLEKEITE